MVRNNNFAGWSASKIPREGKMNRYCPRCGLTVTYVLVREEAQGNVYRHKRCGHEVIMPATPEPGKGLKR